MPKGSPKGGGVGLNKCQDIQILPAYNPKDGKPISYGGKTYEEWGTAWWIWHSSFNNSLFFSAEGPGDLLQPKNAIFLAIPIRGDTVMRSVQVPKNSYLFFPLVTSVHWYNPGGNDDLPAVSTSFEILGINISTTTKNPDLSALNILEYLIANTTNTCDKYSIPDIISQSRLNQKLPRGTTSPRQRSHRASFHRSLCLLRVLPSISFSNQLIRAICLLLYIHPTFSTQSLHQATTSQSLGDS